MLNNRPVRVSGGIRDIEPQEVFQKIREASHLECRMAGYRRLMNMNMPKAAMEMLYLSVDQWLYDEEALGDGFV